MIQMAKGLACAGRSISGVYLEGHAICGRNLRVQLRRNLCTPAASNQWVSSSASTRTRSISEIGRQLSYEPDSNRDFPLRRS
jgi:hypothetical protein